MVAKTSKRAQVAMPKSMWLYLDSLARERGTTKSKIIEELVYEMMEKNKQEKRP